MARMGERLGICLLFAALFLLWSMYGISFTDSEDNDFNVSVHDNLPSFRHNYETGSYLNEKACKYDVTLNGGCNQPIAYHEMTPHGFGSDLHTWAQSMCWAIMNNYSLVTVAHGSLKCTQSSTGTEKCKINPKKNQHNWIWEDKQLCEKGNSLPLSCYFPHVNRCGRKALRNNLAAPRAPSYNDARNVAGCDIIYGCESEFPNKCGGGFFNHIQYLFSSINPKILAYGQVALKEVFGQEGSPEDLITLHIRWGDKWKENGLVPIKEYALAVEDHVSNHKIKHVNIFITTEDNAAIVEFREFVSHHHPAWKVFSYDKSVQIKRNSSQEETGHSPLETAEQTSGRAGVESIVALLLAMEAKYTVTTASSNWGRLIEELHPWVWSWPKPHHLNNGRIDSVESTQNLPYLEKDSLSSGSSFRTNIMLWGQSLGESKAKKWSRVWEEFPPVYQDMISTTSPKCRIYPTLDLKERAR